MIRPPGVAPDSRPRALASTRAAGAEYAIEVTNLSHRYRETEALKGISFRVPWGRVCGYLGPNGAGKSTTLKSLAGILRPTAGAVRVAGHDIARDTIAAKASIGYVPESGALYGLLTPREHLELVAALYGVAEDEVDARVEQTLESFELTKLADRRIDTLSKGQRQKAVLATAVLHDPDVLLLDEPLNGLDVAGARHLRELVEGWARAGKTVLYCSHILDVVERVCSEVIILAAGEVVAHASTAELVARSEDETLESVFHSLVRSRDVEGLAGLFADDREGTTRDEP